jgi:hypothetical protein
VFQELPAVIRLLLRTVLLQFGSGEHCKNARLANRNQVSLQRAASLKALFLSAATAQVHANLWWHSV